jgi:ATP-dependent Clp protease ATP-binding subunit ClpA
VLPIEKLTPRVVRVLQRADAIASSFGHSFVGTEHLLLAMIEVGGGVASEMIAQLGVAEDLVSRTRAFIESEAYTSRLQ